MIVGRIILTVILAPLALASWLFYLDEGDN